VAEPRSHKQAREELIASARCQGMSWADVAGLIRRQFRVNARVALRMAHGWSQRQAAEQWCARWPDDLKTFKNFSAWEQWPGSTGHAPSLATLDRLARLYECSVSDLLADAEDYRPPIPPDSPSIGMTAASGIVAINGDGVELVTVLGRGLLPERAARGADTGLLPAPASAVSFLTRLQEVDYEQLAEAIVNWAERSQPGVSRRALLSHLSAAFALAAVVPQWTDDVGADRILLTGVSADEGVFDAAALRYCEDMIVNLRRQGDVLGARLTMQSVLGHRVMAERLARLAPASSRDRALSAFAELTQLLGWLCFNAGDHRNAAHFYDQARTAAHEAENVELVTYVLCTMSHLATWEGRPRVGIDHAAAAQVWANQTDSPYARAYAADVAVRAYATAEHSDSARRALDVEQAALAECRPTTSTPSWWYFYDESFYWSTKSKCALLLHDPQAALDAAEDSIALVDPTNLHNTAFRMLFRADAFIQQGHVAEAAQAIGEAVALAAGNTSQRIDQRIIDLRSRMAPWRRTKPVRRLDALLADYRRPVSGST
jgi:hypothetical protein